MQLAMRKPSLVRIVKRANAAEVRLLRQKDTEVRRGVAIDAGSPGRYFRQWIRGKFDGVKV
jgi:hypothetical protein